MQLTTYEHYSGQDELYLDYDQGEFILCAIGRDKSGNNVKQVDLGAYSYNDMKTLLKTMKQYMKDERNG